MNDPLFSIGDFQVTLFMLILFIVAVILLIGIICYRYNHRKQTKVAQYMDEECGTYNKKGLVRYLSHKGRKLTNPTLMVVEIRNLGYLYTNYLNRKDLMYVITNQLINGLTKRETIGRIEFNQFVIAFENRNRDEVKEYVAEIERRFNELVLENYGKYNFYLYFGVYEDVPLGEDADDSVIMTTAIILYSHVKDGNIYYYSDEVRVAVEKLRIMNEQKDPAYEQKRFVPYIQPKVNLRTGKVVGGEILCRWVNDKQEFLYSPGEFIPLFENNGFILKIDELMLNAACALAQTMLQKGRNDIVISVNISKLKFLSVDFEQEIMEVVSKYQVPPKNIELEITESAVMDNYQYVSNCIMSLRQRGFNVAMDDFGKESSTLGSLATNPFDTIKLDMIFFRNKLSTEKDRVIVKKILDMLTKLNYHKVCEGVSDKQTLDVLATINLDVIVQGFCISPAIPVNQFEAFADTIFDFNYPEIVDVDVNGSKGSTTTDGGVKVDTQTQPNGGTSINISGLGQTTNNNAELEAMRRQMEEMRRSFQEQLEEQRRKEHEEELKHLREEIEKAKQKDPTSEEIERLRQEIANLKNQPQQVVTQPQQVVAQPQYVQPYVQRDYRDEEIERLRREIEDIRFQDRYDRRYYDDRLRDRDMDDLQRQIRELKENQNNTQQIDVNELINRLSQNQNDNARYQVEKAEMEAKSLRDKLEQERKEREELEALLNDINNKEEEPELDEAEMAKEQEEADKNLNLDLSSLDENDNIDDSDEEDDDDSDEDDNIIDSGSNPLQKPNLTLEELQAIIKSYQDKYNDHWNEHAKDELKDGYYQVVDGLKYYKGQEVEKKTFLDKIKHASPEVKQLYNIVKNEFMKYGVTNKLTNSYDCFYKGRNVVGKITLTSSKIKVFVAADPNNPKYSTYPHKDMSAKKSHAKTPYYTLVKSQLSVKRIGNVIADAMQTAGLSSNDNYKPIDYATKCKFMKKK